LPRILFLTERYPPDEGGAAASAGRISNTLARDSHVDVVTFTRSLPGAQVAHIEGTPGLYRIGRFREWDSTMGHATNLLDWLHSMHRYDVVWGHFVTRAGFLAVWFAKLNGIASIVSIRGNDLDREVYPPGDFARLQWTLTNATRVAAVTRDLARKAAALTARDDVETLTNAVDTAVFHPSPPDPELRRAVGIRDGEAVLAFSGELREKKGLSHLLHAIAKVRERRPACLLLIGDVRPSEMPRLLQSLSSGTLNDNRILITGQLTTPEAVAAHLRLCDVYLQPSLWDGMPNALLEAMSCGCGSIASDAGGIPEVVTSGVDGILLPRWQLHRLHEAIEEWLDAPSAVRDKVRAAARDRIVTAFNHDIERAALDRLLTSLRTEPPSGSPPRPSPLSSSA
jgi:glycosyltransferase involved in cell wall biosynthesis